MELFAGLFIVRLFLTIGLKLLVHFRGVDEELPKGLISPSFFLWPLIAVVGALFHIPVLYWLGAAMTLAGYVLGFLVGAYNGYRASRRRYTKDIEEIVMQSLPRLTFIPLSDLPLAEQERVRAQRQALARQVWARHILEQEAAETEYLQ